MTITNTGGGQGVLHSDHLSSTSLMSPTATRAIIRALHAAVSTKTNQYVLKPATTVRIPLTSRFGVMVRRRLVCRVARSRSVGSETCESPKEHPLSLRAHLRTLAEGTAIYGLPYGCHSSSVMPGRSVISGGSLKSCGDRPLGVRGSIPASAISSPSSLRPQVVQKNVEGAKVM